MKTERNSMFLMANLGAEVSRLLSARKNNDEDLAGAASERAKMIIAQIRSCVDMSKRAKEIDILDEVIEDVISDNPRFRVLPKNLMSYFTPFMMGIMG